MKKGLFPFLIETASEKIRLYAANEYDALQQFNAMKKRKFSLVPSKDLTRTLR